MLYETIPSDNADSLVSYSTNKNKPENNLCRFGTLSVMTPILLVKR